MSHHFWYFGGPGRYRPGQDAILDCLRRGTTFEALGRPRTPNPSFLNTGASGILEVEADVLVLTSAATQGWRELPTAPSWCETSNAKASVLGFLTCGPVDLRSA